MEVINSVKVSIVTSPALNTDGGASAAWRADLPSASDFVQSAMVVGNGKPENTLMLWEYCSGHQYSQLTEGDVSTLYWCTLVQLTEWAVFCQVLMI